MTVGSVRAQDLNRSEKDQDRLNAIELNRVKLPNGWSLTPAGRSLPLGDLPLNIAVSRNHRYAAVTNN
ncbi:MAG: hypothetical protein JST42_28665, partial [Bacteroidetes bacterium]|nr:hypothetical protein [Bacteroidota bacterium]